MSNLFITGTGTDVGKTVISAWLSMHSGYDYWKPIQTYDDLDSRDSVRVRALSGAVTHPERYSYSTPASPHLAAKKAGSAIRIEDIVVPRADRLVVEGAGGVLVPLNSKDMIIDLIAYLNFPTILVAKTAIGTINHTLLTLKALRARNIKIAGVIMNGKADIDNQEAIRHYGNIDVLFCFPELKYLDRKTLASIKFSLALERLFNE
jgi:dethiobiotin synthetase